MFSAVTVTTEDEMLSSHLVWWQHTAAVRLSRDPAGRSYHLRLRVHGGAEKWLEVLGKVKISLSYARVLVEVNTVEYYSYARVLVEV